MKPAMNTKTGPAATKTNIPLESKAMANASASRMYNRGTPVKPNVTPQTGLKTDIPGQR